MRVLSRNGAKRVNISKERQRTMKGNERGANVHEKSLIWAAKDTEWKKLEEKGVGRILTGESKGSVC